MQSAHAQEPQIAAIESRPLTTTHAAAQAPQTGPLFERMEPDQTGVRFVNPLDLNHPMKRLYHAGFAAGGVAIGDVDGDGQPDLYLVGGPGRSRLLRQVGDLKFQDITERAGVDGGGEWGSGAAMVDVDNDGDLDLYVCNYDAPNLLYINNGDATFSEEGWVRNAAAVDASLMSAFCDYDLDGDLDLYLLTYRYYRKGGLPSESVVDAPRGKLRIRPKYAKYYFLRRIGGVDSFDYVGRPDRLLRNDGDGTFTDVSHDAGVHSAGHGISATWWDYNHDGLPDLYVANDFTDPDHLYRNNGGGTFTDVAPDVLPHTTWSSMGADLADFNNDGLMDFLVADMSPTTHFMQKRTMGAMLDDAGKAAAEALRPRQYMRNALYVNSGTDHFMEVAYLAQVADSDWSWAVKCADLDNDGRVDVFITNGTSRSFNDSDLAMSNWTERIGRTQWDRFEKTPPRLESNMALRNLGQWRFDDVGKSWGLDHKGMSLSAALADLDRDGDLDLVVANLDEPVSIYRNRSADLNLGHRLLLRLEGTASNRAGIGATVQIQTASGPQWRYLSPMTGFKSGNDPVVHFGLGDDTVIQKLSVQWPGGHSQVFEHLDADRFYTVREPLGTPPKQAAPPTRPTLYRRSDVLQGIVHRERVFDDYERQPLLPFKLSQFGPGLAWGDADGDGDEDLYVGAAAGKRGAVFIHGDDGRFKRRELEVENVKQERAHEDMAPLWLDADSDGDMDLYVVSGGVECEPADEVLRDRLFLNNGHGHLTEAPRSALPDLRDSGSVAAAADFDRDGDLDIFVGGRVVPGQYPLTPPSRLLRNEGGRFSDATEELAPKLHRSGMVTSAVWSDADGDGDADLLVTHEWGPVKLFRNDKGHLHDRTHEAGLDKHLGWWNGIAARDLDGDGDIDYVATNVGLNTKYHADNARPVLLYYGDFEDAGRARLIEAEYEDDTLFPIRGRSCSTNAMPFLGQKFTSFRDFAGASLETIYTPQCLKDATRLEANTLESVVLINDGHGRFRIEPLPRLAQVSPSFGVVLTEVNGDDRPDLYLVQNFYGPQIETGRMDSGLSLLLTGGGPPGQPRFDVLWPRRSGLVVPGDAKGLTISDLNGDAWPDFVVGINDDALMAFEHQGSNERRVISVRLRGGPGNPTAVGARIRVHLDDGSAQTAEVHAGGGFLSQSTSALVFGLGANRHVAKIEVRWPDGRTTTTEEVSKAPKVLIEKPR